MNSEHYKIRMCVLILLIKNDNIFLLSRKTTGWSDGFYAIPGGSVEANESIQDACIREAQEELGIVIPKNNLKLIQISHIKRDDNFQYLMFSFSTTVWQGEAYNKEPEKHHDAQWFSITNLPTNLAPFAKDIIEAYQNNKVYKEYGW